jgi:hypothetical protein
VKNLGITGRLQLGNETFSGVLLSDKAAQKLFEVFDPEMNLNTQRGGVDREKKRNQ